jgi:hypothetical protein
LKAMGIDPEELRANVDAFMTGMKAQAEKINANQARLEEKLDRIIFIVEELLPQESTREIIEDGQHTGVLVTNERFPQAMIDDVNGRN